MTREEYKDPLSNIKNYVPGIMICAIIAIAAKFVALQTALPVMMLCLFFGMAFHFLSKDEISKHGIQYTSKSLLRIGVALIGARIVLSDFTALGFNTIAIVVATTLAIIVLGVLLSRLLKSDDEQGLLIGGATAICGASAALAISATLPHSKTLEQNTLIAVIGVTAIGTIAMITYPFVIQYIGYNDHEAGILVGGAIHDVAQVVGAGYSISEEAGDTAIIIKLIRVCMLVPLLFVFAFAFKNHKEQGDSKTSPLPLFIVSFIVLVILNSVHVIPTELSVILKSTSKWLLIMAITAVGMKTSFKALFSLGWKPIALVLVNSIVIFGVYAAIIMFSIA